MKPREREEIDATLNTVAARVARRQFDGGIHIEALFHLSQRRDKDAVARALSPLLPALGAMEEQIWLYSLDLPSFMRRLLTGNQKERLETALTVASYHQKMLMRFTELAKRFTELNARTLVQEENTK